MSKEGFSKIKFLLNIPNKYYCNINIFIIYMEIKNLIFSIEFVSKQESVGLLHWDIVSNALIKMKKSQKNHLL